jgi:hypothetical protein
MAYENIFPAVIAFGEIKSVLPDFSTLRFFIRLDVYKV